MIFRTSIQLLTVTAALVVAACAATQPQTTGAEKQEAADASTAPDQAPEIVDTFEGDGMEIPLDGSSLAAFEASMARIKRHVSDKDYTTLESSIEYLLFYDIGAGGSREELAARLDGLNGYQVIARVPWNKKEPDKNKETKYPESKKMIDT